MTLVAPVNLAYNVKTLWFDPKGLDIHADDKLVVRTARGVEMGVAAGELLEVTDEQVRGLKSPLQPVLRIATDEDVEKASEMERLSAEALPVFKEMARETSEDMHPVSVEYMLDGDKAVFYFEAEKRIDFRELVRKLASTFHVRIDMRQIGVRDEARIVGGVAHCGQVVCCKRLGGEFKPVSIRMAKDQDLSLNSQKISGLCGRLMCCLRYEEDIYKEFKSHAPKVDARVKTPDGEGRVTEHDVPRDMVAIKAGDQKPVRIPLSAIKDVAKDRKSCSVDADAWQEALDEADSAIYGGMQMIELPSFTGEDKLGSGKAVHNATSRSRNGSRAGSGSGSGGRSSKKGSGSGSGGSSRRRGSKGGGDSSESPSSNRRSRRRSTKISGASGERETTSQGQSAPDSRVDAASSASSSGGSGAGSSKGRSRSGRRGVGSKQNGSGQRRGGKDGSSRAQGVSSGNAGDGSDGRKSQGAGEKKGKAKGRGSSGGSRVRPGQKSSALAQGRSSQARADASAERSGDSRACSAANGNDAKASGSAAGNADTNGGNGNGAKRRRRRRRSGSGSAGGNANAGSAGSGNGSDGAGAASTSTGNGHSSGRSSGPASGGQGSRSASSSDSSWSKGE